jgi:hypothetical protein
MELAPDVLRGLRRCYLRRACCKQPFLVVTVETSQRLRVVSAEVAIYFLITLASWLGGPRKGYGPGVSFGAVRMWEGGEVVDVGVRLEDSLPTVERLWSRLSGVSQMWLRIQLRCQQEHGRSCFQYRRHIAPNELDHLNTGCDRMHPDETGSRVRPRCGLLLPPSS